MHFAPIVEGFRVRCKRALDEKRSAFDSGAAFLGTREPSLDDIYAHASLFGP